MEKGKESLFDVLAPLIAKENSMENSGLGEIISKYYPENDYEIEINNELDRHLRYTLKHLSTLYSSFDNVLFDQNIAPMEDSRLFPKVSSDPEKEYPAKLETWLKDNEVWQRTFIWIIENDWPLNKEKPFDLYEQCSALLFFYYKALHAREITLNDLFPVILKAAEKVQELSVLLGIWIGDNGHLIKKELTAIKKDRTRKHTKYTTDWAELISLVLDLSHQGKFKEAKYFDNVLEKILVEVSARKEIKKISHKHSRGTITRCLEQVFGLTPKNFSQPLTLVIKDHLW